MTEASTTTPAGRLGALMLRYCETHQTLANKRLHMICVPAIILSTLGIFSAIPTSENILFSSAQLAVTLASIYYFQFRSFRMLVGVWLMSAASFLVISTLGEHRLVFSVGLLIGPLWVLYQIAPSIFFNSNSNQGFTI